jgi:hypothetical protein
MQEFRTADPERRSHLLSRRVLQFMVILKSVNGLLADCWTFNLPIDYYTKLPAKIEGVISAGVQQAASNIHPENVLVIAVGDKAKI